MLAKILDIINYWYENTVNDLAFNNNKINRIGRHQLWVDKLTYLQRQMIAKGYKEEAHELMRLIQDSYRIFQV